MMIGRRHVHVKFVTALKKPTRLQRVSARQRVFKEHALKQTKPFCDNHRRRESCSRPIGPPRKRPRLGRKSSEGPETGAVNRQNSACRVIIIIAEMAGVF